MSRRADTPLGPSSISAFERRRDDATPGSVSPAPLASEASPRAPTTLPRDLRFVPPMTPSGTRLSVMDPCLERRPVAATAAAPASSAPGSPPATDGPATPGSVSPAPLARAASEASPRAPTTLPRDLRFVPPMTPSGTRLSVLDPCLERRPVAATAAAPASSARGSPPAKDGPGALATSLFVRPLSTISSTGSAAARRPAAGPSAADHTGRGCPSAICARRQSVTPRLPRRHRRDVDSALRHCRTHQLGSASHLSLCKAMPVLFTEDCVPQKHLRQHARS